MFCRADMSFEITTAEREIQIPIYRETKRTLQRIEKIPEVKESVDAMKSSLVAFGINLADNKAFIDAVGSFEGLLGFESASYSFSDIRVCLKTIFDLAEGLSKETVNILNSLGKCSSLLEFLQTIVDEDIRNLIDAVEDISEQYVSESTVSGLIEVKRFLHPLLKPTFEKSGKNLFQTVARQTKKLKKDAIGLPAKMDECMEHIHNLKSLYTNVANRGEQTKETIKNIVTKGFFHFTLDKENNKCDVRATYTHAKTKVSQSRSTLVDLRSRALLLMNTERKGSETHLKSDELEKFIGYADMCLDIAEMVYTLHTSGHVRFANINIIEEPIHLEHTKHDLYEELCSWQVTLLSERKTHYLMNFIHGLQIHTLHDYLEKNLENEDIESLLRYVHPHLSTRNLRHTYSIERRTYPIWNDTNMLHCIGQSLHLTFHELTPFERMVASKEEHSKRITEVVQNGKLLLAHLDESSLLVVRIILALYANTTQRLPEANQLLFCTRDTTWSELQLLLSRCLGAYIFSRVRTLFCIANVEMLLNEIQFKLVDALRHINEENDFLLAVVCRGTKHHPFIDELSDHVMTVRPLSDQKVRDILSKESPDVCTITSTIAGLGKSNTISNMAHDVQKAIVSLHISGSVNKKTIVERLRDLRLDTYHVLHLDIGNVHNHVELDTFLFELLILRHVTAGTVSASLPTSHISIEIANTINDSLQDSLQTAVSFRRVHLRWKDYRDFIISKEIQSPVQVVCHFLYLMEKGELDETDVCFTGAYAVKPISARKCRILLRMYMPTIRDLSFTVVNISLSVLADQLKKMACSAFFKTSRIRDMIGTRSVSTVKSTLTKALVDVSQEFTLKSVNACRLTQSSTLTADVTNKAKENEHIPNRLEGIIQWENSNHLIYVFHNQNIQTISPLYRDITKVPSHITQLFEGQMKKKMQDFKFMNQSQLQTLLQKIARADPMPLPQPKLLELASEYALTPDNLLKMVLIMLRIKARIPVVVMGETGCGKTSLIRYLAAICEVQFVVMNIHAGIEEQAIILRVFQSNEDALKDLNTELWLFLDEINTCEHIGLISDIICHHKCLEKSLAPNLVIMGACNPYKLRSATAISTAGIEGKVKTDELSRFVYRVLPLPEMLVDFVWDFGSLSEKDEAIYIKRMVADVFREDGKKHELLTALLATSQQFVRDHERTLYSVSLRDVQRCKTLTKWFASTLERRPLSLCISIDISIKAIILALAHCYHCRFSKKCTRKAYRYKMENVFKQHRLVLLKEKLIHDIIKQEQKDIIERMDLPNGTAKNTALQENVFVILVCILNRIPIFVVGKPGCSKSLAMQIIRSNLRGKDSKDEFFKTLPQLYCVSFQGSESSTSDGISKVFTKAEKYQKSNSNDEVLSVVILDEIGLAEISQFNPLKVLHNLLEPDGQSLPNVAVVGISNWSLDASKMNRAIHLSRPDMDQDELYETGISISESFERKDSPTLINRFRSSSQFHTFEIKKKLHSIAESYFLYSRDLEIKNFHGLRDYYSLVKYIAKELSEADIKLSDAAISIIVMTGILRNFGGLPVEQKTLMAHFQIHFRNLSRTQIPVTDLITSNVTDQMARNLMLITTGESVLGIVEKKLSEIDREKKEIIFGSQFEEDLTDDYNYRILSRIILCMEQGLVLILKDLENIYGSLYDMLNQNYTVIGNKKICRIALGPYSNPMCHVADSFRCIVLVDESKLDLTDPPFLNRFEKQYLRFSDILSETQAHVIQILEKWIDGLSNIRGKHFTRYDTFPNYSEDMVASLILKLHRESQALATEIDEERFISKCKATLLWAIRSEVVVRLSESMDVDILNELETIKEQYFSLPVHEGMATLMKYHLIQEREQVSMKSNGIMVVVFTNSNIHTKILQNVTERKSQVEKLGSFKSEKQLATRMKHFWLESDAEVMFLQCSAIDDEKHVMLAKTIIEKCRYEFNSKGSTTRVKHVYLVIHIDRNNGTLNIVSQINYLSEWRLVMIDCLERPQTTLPELCSSSLKSVIMKKRPLVKHIKEQLFWAFTRIKYTNGQGRNVASICNVLEKMKQSTDFLSILDERISAWISEHHDNLNDLEWHVKVACNSQAIHTSSSFANALEMYILSEINIPLSKLVYQMEDMNIIDSYFINDDFSKQRQKSWEDMLANEKIFSIETIRQESGPETCMCDSKDFCLRTPFGLLLYESVETTRDEFLESITLLKGKCDLDEDDDLPPEIYSDLLQKQECLVLQKLTHIAEFEYDAWNDDYIYDFCNLVSYSRCSSIPQSIRIAYIRWAISQKTDLSCKYPSELFVRLHTTFWANASLFNAELQLLETCKHVLINEDEDIVQSLIETGLNTAFINRDAPGKNADVAIEENSSNEKYTWTQHDVLVDYVCKKMIPTTQTLERFEGVSVWQCKTNCVLALAAQVSQVPKSIHALRLCNDVAAGLIIPFTIGDTLLKNVGHLCFEDHDLDSEYVFQALMHIIQVAPATARMNSQRMLSNYFIRCLSSDPDTSALLHLTSLVSESKLPDMSCSLLKLPLQLALKYELDENEDVFLEILYAEQKNDSGGNLSELDGDAESIACESHSCNLDTLDMCLKQIDSKGNNNDSFAVLLVDLMKDMYMESFEENELIVNGNKNAIKHFMHCCTVLKKSVFGIQYIAAVAYFKTFVESFGRVFQTCSLNPNTLVVINACFQDITENSVSMALATFFLKAIGTNLLVSRVDKFCERGKKELTFLENICLDHTYLNEYFEGSPLSCHIREKAKNLKALFDDPPDRNEFQNRIAEFVNEASTSSEGMIALYSVAMKHFYIPRSYMAVSDTVFRQAGVILKEAIAHSIQKPKIVLLKCLLGREDFKVHEFMHSEESTSADVSINSVLSSLFGLLLAFNKSSSKDDNTMLATCLMEPQGINEMFLPGFPDNNLDASTTIEDAEPSLLRFKFATCECGHRISTHGTVEKFRCIICQKTLHPIVKTGDEEIGHVNSKAGFVTCDGMKEIWFGARGLSSVTCNILYIFIKGCILGSLALGFADAKTIENVTLISEIDVAQILSEDINCHWENLAKLLNLASNSVGLFLHTIMLHTRDLLCEICSPIKTSTDRDKWENVFSISVNVILKERFQKMHDIVKQHAYINKLSTNSVIMAIYELDEPSRLLQEDNLAKLSSMLRIQGGPTIDNFILELQLHKSSFPFLRLVLKSRSKLKLPIHIVSIVLWHTATVSNANYVMKRQECLNMTVLDFIHFSGDDKKKATVRQRFDEFQKSWTLLSKHELFDNINRISYQSKMSECLILGTDSIVYEVLETLVTIQNTFLDNALEMAPVCPAAHFLSREPTISVVACVQISEVKKQHIVDLTSPFDTLLNESQCDLSYGRGRQIYYDFDSSERRLAMQVLVGKLYIQLENSLPKIVFTDELYRNYVSLVTELKAGVKQYVLPTDIADKVKKERDYDPRMITELLMNLGVIMTLLKKTKGDSTQSLTDYAEEWKNLLTIPFPNDLLPSPPSSVKLCHVVALYELLEELNSDTVIDDIDEQFRVNLDMDLKNHFTTLTKENANISELVLKAIRRFSHRCLSLREADPEETMFRYLSDESFWPDGVAIDGIINTSNNPKIVDVLPPTLMVKHVYATVTLISEELEKQQEDDPKLEQMVMKFNSQKGEIQTNKTTRKRKSAKACRNF